MFTLDAPQTTCTEDDLSDFSDYGDFWKRIEPVTSDDYANHVDDMHAVVPLMGMHCGYNPWRALSKFDILNQDIHFLMTESAHVCPITNQSYNALLPRAIHFLHPEQRHVTSLAKPGFSYMFQPGFIHAAKHCYGGCEDQNEDGVRLSLNDIERVLLGTGYTDCMLPYDGHSEIVPVRIPLVIDRLPGTMPAAYLLCAARKWLNK